jgi:hypothetical protein
MRDTLLGYTRGEPVEFRFGPEADDWQPGTVYELDFTDSTLPIRVEYGSRGQLQWCRPHNIRKIGGSVRPRLQYKVWDEWHTIELDPTDPDAECGENIGGTYVRFRYAPSRTEAEILAKIRDERSENGELADWRLSEILNGEF